MKRVSKVAIVGVALAVCGSVAASADGRPERQTFRHENTPENLKLFLETIVRKLHVEKAPAEAIAMFRGTLPDPTRLRRAIRSDLPAETVQKIVSYHAGLTAMTDEQVRQVTKPEQTVVRVYGATTGEIVDSKEGSIAAEQFPGGAVRMARDVLAPGVTFYEVEFIEPGKDSGIVYHLFYWDGTRWTMLGPIWRALS